MKFKIINANDLSRYVNFPDTVDMRMQAIITEQSEDNDWLVIVLRDYDDHYLLRVFSLNKDGEATLEFERKGFLTYLEGRIIGRAVARFVKTTGDSPLRYLTARVEELTDWIVQEDTFPAGMNLFVEVMSRQLIRVMMVGSPGVIEQFPCTLSNKTVTLPEHIVHSLTLINSKIKAKSGSYARLKRPLKTGDLLYADDSVPAYAAMWVLTTVDGTLVVYPIDPTFDFSAWMRTPVEEHRKGPVHCFKTGHYKHKGFFG